jgi:hypothetical protein
MIVLLIFFLLLKKIFSNRLMKSKLKGSTENRIPLEPSYWNFLENPFHKSPRRLKEEVNDDWARENLRICHLRFAEDGLQVRWISAGT